MACPCCGRESGPPHRNTTFPFCSRGCKLADLGRWLDGAYALDPVSGRLEVVDPDEAEELDPDALH
ncbi:MAG: DNA gyrase inhibitor YacG [Deltaproteobacteria bacterium]|nr:MAG: DNA gyrase inhibitor YacG [Deltaproteobacteria bacterium]